MLIAGSLNVLKVWVSVGRQYDILCVGQHFNNVGLYVWNHIETNINSVITFFLIRTFSNRLAPRAHGLAAESLLFCSILIVILIDTI